MKAPTCGICGKPLGEDAVPWQRPVPGKAWELVIFVHANCAPPTGDLPDAA